MAKGVPILGKDPLGKAKYANVTESGDLRVQLSGTNAVILAEHKNNTLHYNAYNFLNWGVSVGASSLPVDCSRYPKKVIMIHADLKMDETERTIDYIVFGLLQNDSVITGSTAYPENADVIVPWTTLPHGATIYLTGVDHPKLNIPYVGILVRTRRTNYSDSNTGSVSVTFVGGA